MGLYKGSLALVVLQSVTIGGPVMLVGGGVCDLFGPCCLLESFGLEVASFCGSCWIL